MLFRHSEGGPQMFRIYVREHPVILHALLQRHVIRFRLHRIVVSLTPRPHISLQHLHDFHLLHSIQITDSHGIFSRAIHVFFWLERPSAPGRLQPTQQILQYRES
jgi:hypothetical protein